MTDAKKTSPESIQAIRNRNPQAVAKWEAQQMMNAQRREKKRRREMVARPILSERTGMTGLLPKGATIDEMLRIGRDVIAREGPAAEKSKKKPRGKRGLRGKEKSRGRGDPS